MVTLGSIDPGTHPRRRAALAAHALRVALSDVGLLEQFPECAADVADDRAVVHLGTVDADAALALAERLRSSKRGRPATRASTEADESESAEVRRQ